LLKAAAVECRWEPAAVVVAVDAVAEVVAVVAPATELHHWLRALIRTRKGFLLFRLLMVRRRQLHQRLADAAAVVVAQRLNRHSRASVHRDAAAFSLRGTRSRRRKRGEDLPDQVRDSTPAALSQRPATSSSRM
jgi:hypothetical protein